MRKALFVVLGFILVFAYMYLKSTRDEKIITRMQQPTTFQEKSLDTNIKSINGLFVPYWTVRGPIDVSSYDEVYYFGVAANSVGLNTNEAGFTTLPEFAISIPQNTTSFLTIRMLNFDINSKVLRDEILQNRIIQDSIDLAHEYSFSGILLDFEMNGLAFDSFVASINKFYENWYELVKQKKLKFYITIYGDTFYRFRPYDITFLGKKADKILIMAYDFHKARGNPGPNFPLSGKDVWGYDLNQMANDFLEVVESEKLAVVFGFFGYDWKAVGTTHSSGNALSYNQIKERFITNCLYTSCSIEKDQKSGETKIEYTDNGTSHIVWFEDEISVKKKSEFLKKMGINSFASWAYGYF